MKDTTSSPVPVHILTKYAGHTAVHLTHVLPGAIWAGLVPFQLHPTLRQRRPRLHRIAGYIFVAISLLMAVGVFIILQRNLLFEHYFDVPPNDEKDAFSILLQLLPPTQEFLSCLALYHMGTMVAAIGAARKQRFAQHRQWMIRHVASGIWVALQRLLLLTVGQAMVLLVPPITPAQQRNTFRLAAYIAIIICIGMGEYVIYVLGKQQSKSSTRYSTPKKKV